MAVRNKLSSVDRVIALSLGVVWLGMGATGLVLGLIHGQFILVALAFFAIWYGVLWFRVAARSRKLTSWREFIMPWRAQ
jgi:uncharacterized membrane protein YbaN (DUF454 family)